MVAKGEKQFVSQDTKIGPKKISNKIFGFTNLSIASSMIQKLIKGSRLLVFHRNVYLMHFQLLSTFSPNKCDYMSHHKQRRHLREHIPFVTDVKKVKDPCEALALFEDYHERGFKHHYPSYSSLIYKLARSRRFEAVETMLGHLQNRNIRCNETLFVALIQHYGKAHLVEKGQ